MEKNRKEMDDIISRLVENLAKFGEIELEDVTIEAQRLRIRLPQALLPAVRRKIAPPAPALPEEIARVEFTYPKTEWTGNVTEVKIGATKGEGGTRSNSVIIGGETAPPFYRFAAPMTHPPVIAFDVFDMKTSLPRSIRTHYEEVMEDPGEWAKRCVNKYNAEMINLHLISTDPLVKDTTPREAAKSVEKVLQSVNVPITVGGSGDPAKDMEVFKKVAEVAEGERVMVNSIVKEMDLSQVAPVMKEHGHIAVAFTPMDLDLARELNRKLFDYLPKDQIVMDTNTGALGYGLEYGFTVMERARLAALRGDEELQQPLLAGTTNAWGARESWLKMDPQWEPRELRGPLWEFTTALTMMLAGADYLMMMHPASIKTLKDVMNDFLTGEVDVETDISNWAGAKI
ncbi:MAG: CO dehydrogenase/acetyl-CoA synthase subunit delta [Aigarchaeota archaeon]|nr:CO dehydrogenase/acetyl-CoA synthase subunit delta [Aigarchaeota archaeon]